MGWTMADTTRAWRMSELDPGFKGSCLCLVRYLVRYLVSNLVRYLVITLAVMLYLNFKGG